MHGGAIVSRHVSRANSRHRLTMQRQIYRAAETARRSLAVIDQNPKIRFPRFPRIWTRALEILDGESRTVANWSEWRTTINNNSLDKWDRMVFSIVINNQGSPSVSRMENDGFPVLFSFLPSSLLSISRRNFLPPPDWRFSTTKLQIWRVE